MELIKKQTSATNTKNKYWTTYAPKAMSQHYRQVQTVAQALDTPSHGIAQLKRELGNEKVEALIKIQLIYLDELLNLKRPLNEIQIDEIAAEVVATHYHLTMADVHVIMRRARTGYYGEFYESLNLAKVLKWFADYFEERCQVGAQRSLDAHAQVKEWNDTNRKSLNEKQREAFATARAHCLIEKAKKTTTPKQKRKTTHDRKKNRPTKKT